MAFDDITPTRVVIAGMFPITGLETITIWEWSIS